MFNLINYIKRNCVLFIFVSASILYSVLAPIWTDGDGIYLIKSAILGATNPLAVYDEWIFGSHYYGWGPFYSWILLIVHPIFNLLGFTAQSVAEGWAFNPFTYFLFKWLTKIPFVLWGGIIFYKIYGQKGAILWLFSPLIIWFVIMAGLNDIYPAFFLTLGLYFLNKDKILNFVLCIAFGLLAKQTIQIALPVLILMLIFSKRYKSIIYIILIFLPYYIITLPYKLYSSGFQRLMTENFFARLPVHLGFTFQKHGLFSSYTYISNIIFISCILLLLFISKPKLNLENFCLWTTPLYLIYCASSGLGYERWTVTLLPLLIVVVFVLVKSFNKNIIFLYFLFSSLPLLNQLAFKQGQLNGIPAVLIRHNPLDLINKLIGTELTHRAIGEYLLSIESGFVIFFIILIAVAAGRSLKKNI